MIHAKNKGKGFELEVAKLIRQSGLDKEARRRPLSGAEKMVRGHADIITHLPFSIECKKQERMNFWDWWEQAESQSNMNYPPMVVFSSNFRPAIASLKLTDFLNILKELDDWKQSYIKEVGK